MGEQSLTDSTLPVDAGPTALAPTPCWSLCWLHPPELARRSPLRAGVSCAIGRNAASQVVLESGQVSRQHAEIFWRGDGLFVRDLTSRNGTFVNGRLIDHTALHCGDVLRVGDQLALVMRGLSDAALEMTEVASGFWAGPTLRKALEAAQLLAKTDLPLVIRGATGTGKERAARAVHEWSERSGPFVAINCAAIPEHLAEAELFGYRQGAFTGADKASLGHLRAAHRGTLLLDEVADLPLSLQAKLLRAVEQGGVQPLGQAQPLPIDVRFIAASQTSLLAEVEKGRFRSDLAARLDGLTLELPDLSSRKDEIPALFAQLLMNRLGSSLPALDVQLVERLMLYAWPGNVRELDLLVRRLLGLHGHEPRLLAAHLAGTALEGSCPPEAPLRGASTLDLPRGQRDQEALLAALRDCTGNLTRAAAQVGISRQRAYRLLQERSDVNLDALRKRELQ